MTRLQDRSTPRSASNRPANRSPSRTAPASTAQSARANYERYLMLARAQAQAGDHVEAENYYQHAEHYFRAMADILDKPANGAEPRIQ